jgi:hypothetical protein
MVECPLVELIICSQVTDRIYSVTGVLPTRFGCAYAHAYLMLVLIPMHKFSSFCILTILTILTYFYSYCYSL